MIFMLRLENSLLCKQNGITSQIVHYHFEDGVLHFLGVSHINKKNHFLFLFYTKPQLYQSVVTDSVWKS